MVNPFSLTQPYPSTGWVFTGTPGFPLGIHHQDLSPGNGRTSVNGTRQGTNDCAVQDLTDPSRLGTTVSDTDFRLRVRLFFSGFRNTDVSFEGSNTIDIVLSDKDQTFNSADNQAFLGVRVANFDGNNPTFGIRSTPSFRGLARAIGKDGAVSFGSPNFTAGGPPIINETTDIEIIRAGTLLTANLYAPGGTFSVITETQIFSPIPAAVVGLKFLKIVNFNFNNPNASFVQGFMTSFEILNGGGFTPILPIFENGIAAKIFNDLGVNGPSTGDEVFARIFDDGNFPETWSRIREEHMYGFLENNSLIKRDIDRVTWDITTWSVV